jgi:hypothetical protein
MRLPTIHLNGTSRQYLHEEALAASAALRAAVAALEAITVNGRDYYPQGPDAYAEAAREHRERIERVRVVLGEVYALLDHLDEGR